MQYLRIYQKSSGHVYQYLHSISLWHYIWLLISVPSLYEYYVLFTCCFTCLTWYCCTNALEYVAPDFLLCLYYIVIICTKVKEKPFFPLSPPVECAHKWYIISTFRRYGVSALTPTGQNFRFFTTGKKHSRIYTRVYLCIHR